MNHYARKLTELNKGKDSVFEPCTVLEYNSDTMLARVYGTNSKQTKNDVPVLFPAMYLNSGIISPPMKESTGLLFWGSENQSYLMPGYFLTPIFQSDGTNKFFTASPKRIDSSFDLSAVEGGEHLIRSHGGAYIFLKNLDEVELGTSKLHRLSLHGSDGSLEEIVERKAVDIGGYRSYNGPVSDTNHDHLIKTDIDDTLPQWNGTLDDKALIAEILTTHATNDNASAFSPIYTSQMGNVYDNVQKQKSSVDNVDLFFRALLGRSTIPNFSFDISKEGAISLKLQDARYETLIQIRAGGMTMQFTDSQAVPADRVRTQNFGF
jgi:hypothetical protein